MAALATLMGKAANLTLTGLVETVVIASVLGAVGGAIRQLIKLWFGVSGMARGVVVGLVLFVFSAALWWFRWAESSDALVLAIPTLAVVAGLYVVFGVVLEKYATRTEQR
jgi:hypothetical protein